MRDLFELIKKLETEKWSGEIQVTASEGNAFVVLQQGHFLYAYRPFDRALERLEKLQWVNLPPENISSKIRSWDDFVKQILHLNPENYEALIRYFKTDRFEVFLRIFFWTNLELLPRPYEVNLSKQPEIAFYSPRELSKLLKEATTRAKELPVIQEKIGSSRRIFISQVPSTDSSMRRLHPDAIDMALSEFAEEMGVGVLDQSSFTDEELDIINLCDGRNSVQDIIRLSPDGEFLTLRRMIDLWDRGVILPKEEMKAGLKNPKLRTQAKVTWRDFYAAFVLAALPSLIFFVSSYTQRDFVPPTQLSTQLYQALTVYRVHAGRYPVSFSELDESPRLRVLVPEAYEYKLLNLSQYSLELRPLP